MLQLVDVGYTSSYNCGRCLYITNPFWINSYTLNFKPITSELMSNFTSKKFRSANCFTSTKPVLHQDSLGQGGGFKVSWVFGFVVLVVIYCTHVYTTSNANNNRYLPTQLFFGIFVGELHIITHH